VRSGESLDIIEVSEAGPFKINPLAAGAPAGAGYINENDVPTMVVKQELQERWRYGTLQTGEDG